MFLPQDIEEMCSIEKCLTDLLGQPWIYGLQRCGSRGIDKRLATLAVWLHFEAHRAERAAWQYSRRTARSLLSLVALVALSRPSVAEDQVAFCQAWSRACRIRNVAGMSR